MSAEYKLRLYTPLGVPVAEITDFLSLQVIKRLNEPGLARVTLRADHQTIETLSHNSLIEIYRRNAVQGIGWYRLFGALYVDEGIESNDDGSDTFSTECPGELSLLTWRSVLWKSGTANRSVFSNVRAETIVKTLVERNITSAATAASGRERDGSLAGLTITVQPDSAGGNLLNIECAWDGLLSVLQNVCGTVGGGDIDLIKTGAASWEFRWYSGHRGTDRSATVTFAREYGNMGSPSYRRDRRDERTVAIVLGPGQGAQQTIDLRTSIDYSATNNTELIVSATGEQSAAARDVTGDIALDERKARYQFRFTPLQTPSSQIDRDYFLGDLVRARYRTVNVVQKIVGATFSLNSNGNEQISVEMRDV
jgi:hypothetical protein